MGSSVTLAHQHKTRRQQSFRLRTCGCRMYRLRFRRNKNLRTTSLALLVACLSTPVFAQKQATKQTPDSGQKQAETAGAQTADTQKEKEEGEDKNPWKGLQYRLVSPFRGGRLGDIDGGVRQGKGV